MLEALEDEMVETGWNIMRSGTRQVLLCVREREREWEKEKEHNVKEIGTSTIIYEISRQTTNDKRFWTRLNMKLYHPTTKLIEMEKTEGKRND